MRRVFREQPAGAESLGERPFGSQALNARALSLFLQGGSSLPSSLRALTSRAWLAAPAGFWKSP